MLRFFHVLIMIQFERSYFCAEKHDLTALAPCIACMRYQSFVRSERQKRHGLILKNSQGCPESCVDCGTSFLTCHSGVTVSRDGCHCCMICTRQQGEACSTRYICDPDPLKKLECVNSVCRVKQPQMCWFNGIRYVDGDYFNTTCRWNCHCQGGRVVCVDRCPHENAGEPDHRTCSQARLIAMPDRCCKEWVCESSQLGMGMLISTESNHVNSVTLDVRLKREESSANESANKDVLTLRRSGGIQQDSWRCPENKRYTTPWSACTLSCGVGYSFRHTTDNVECKRVREQRLCEIRACRMDDYRLLAGDCTPTVKVAKPITMEYYHHVEGKKTSTSARRIRCTSVREWQPKFCSTCRGPEVCCTPQRLKTKQIEFKCEDRQHRIRQWAWVKRCVCRPGPCLI